MIVVYANLVQTTYERDLENDIKGAYHCEKSVRSAMSPAGTKVTDRKTYRK